MPVSKQGQPLYIYFAEDPISGLVKIGYSGNIRGRLKALRYEFRNQSIRIVASARGDHQTEIGLQTLFKADRVQGEWFRCSPAMEALIGFIRSFPEVRADVPSLVLERVA